MNSVKTNLPIVKGRLEWKRQDYAVREPVLQDVLRELQLRRPDRDLFSSETNRRCPKFFNEADRALERPWTGEFFWCNPPFSLLTLVVEKILSERPEILIVVPDWLP